MKHKTTEIADALVQQVDEEERYEAHQMAEWSESGILVANCLGMLAFPPQLVATRQPLGDHIMGAVVVAWLAEAPLLRWGEEFLSAGAQSFRFRQHLVEGDVLRAEIDDNEEELTILLRDTEGRVASEAHMWSIASEQVPPVPEEAVAVSKPLAPEILQPGQSYGTVSVNFDAAREQSFLAYLPHQDLWQAKGIAHPAWLLSVANAVMRLSVALPLPNSAQAGVTIRLHAPIFSGAELRVTGQVKERFSKGDRHFLVSDIFLVQDQRVAATLELVSCYWPTSEVEE